MSIRLILLSQIEEVDKLLFVIHPHLKELAEDVGNEALEAVQQQAQGGRSTVVARLNPRTRARVGDRIEVVVDTERLHFFDPDTGAGIYGND